MEIDKKHKEHHSKTHPDPPKHIKKASKYYLCPRLYRYAECYFQHIHGHACEFAHSLEELRAYRKSEFMRR